MGNKFYREIRSLDIVILVLISYLVYLYLDKEFFYKRSLNEEFKNYEIVEGTFFSLQISDVAANVKTVVQYKIEGDVYYVQPRHIIPCRESDVKNEHSRNLILNFKFPVAVSESDITNAIPLLTPYDFDLLGVAFPDSQLIVYNDYFNCSVWETFWTED